MTCTYIDLSVFFKTSNDFLKIVKFNLISKFLELLRHVSRTLSLQLKK